MWVYIHHRSFVGRHKGRLGGSDMARRHGQDEGDRVPAAGVQGQVVQRPHQSV